MFQMIIKKLYIALFVGGISTVSFAQDFEKDMTEIGERMENSSTVSISVDVKMYSKKGGRIIYAGSAGMIKSNESTKSVLGEMEFISTPEYELRVDHEEKELLIFKKKAPSDTKIEEREQVEFDVEALKKLIESDQAGQKKPVVKLISRAAGIRTYSISGSVGIVEVILELDMNAKKINSVKYEYGDASSKGQYVILIYTKFLFDSDVSSDFDLTNYFTETDSKYVLASKLNGYYIYTER